MRWIKSSFLVLAIASLIIISGQQVKAANTVTEDAYVEFEKAGRTTLRLVPNFDFGAENKISGATTNDFNLANDARLIDSTNSSIDYDDLTSGITTSMTSGQYATAKDGNKVVRTLMVTDSAGDPSTRWTVNVKMNEFTYGNSNQVSDSSNPITLNINSSNSPIKYLTDAQGLIPNLTNSSDYAPRITSTSIKAGSAATNFLSDESNDSNKGSIGTWAVDFSNKDSAKLYVPYSILKNINSTDSKILLHSTLTWTLISDTPKS